MKAKKLEWKSCITQEAQNYGYIDLVSYIPSNLGLFYIRNYNIENYPKIEESKYFLIFSTHKDDDIYEVSSIEVGKEMAQTIYEKLLIETFFEL